MDEQICATKATHHMKAYMDDKLDKWAYKHFVLCSDIGFTDKTEVCSGPEHDPRSWKPEECDKEAVTTL